MRNKLLITTAAAALVAGTVFAGAQEQKQGAGSAAPSRGASQMQRQQGTQGQVQHQQGTQGQRGALGQQGQPRGTTGQGREESKESKQGQIRENQGTTRNKGGRTAALVFGFGRRACSGTHFLALEDDVTANEQQDRAGNQADDFRPRDQEALAQRHRRPDHGALQLAEIDRSQRAS